MFDIFDLFTSSHPHILISLGSCALVCILASSYPHILRLVCTCLRLSILTSSYLQVYMPLPASLHPHILTFVCACLYPCILTSSYPQVYVCLLVCSHPQINVLSIQMNNCILASPSSLVLGNCASQFANNLQTLRTGQAFVLDFYRPSRKIYWQQPLRADLKKKLLLKSRQNL